MAKDSLHQSERTIQTEPYNVSKFAPNVLELAGKLLGNKSVNSESLMLAISTTRNPGENDSTKMHLPLVESFRQQFKHIDQDKQKDFLTSLADKGFFGTADGTKIQVIDQWCGSSAADAVIIGNLEVLLQTAKDVDADILLGIYSGDENIFAIAPRGDIKQEDFQNLFNTKLGQNLEDYYKDDYWQPMKTALKEAFPNHYLELGMTSNLVTTNKVEVYTPTIHSADGSKREYRPHLRTALGAIIDATSEQYVPPMYSKPLISTFENMLTEADYDDAERAEFEQMYPDHLNIRKIATLPDRINKFREANPGEPTYLIRVADILMKDTNSKSHTLGDNHMIGTVNFLQNYFDKVLQIDPHKNIDYFQHNGSFMFAMSQAQYDQIIPILNDPVELNNYLQLQEIKRQPQEGQDPKLRALPFIVATTGILEDDTMIPTRLESTEPAEKVFQIIEQMKTEQVVNEAIVATYTSGIANSIIHPFVRTIEQVIKDRELMSQSRNTSDTLSSFANLSFFISLFARYTGKRPNNLKTLSRYLHEKDIPLRYHIRNIAHTLREVLVPPRQSK